MTERHPGGTVRAQIFEVLRAWGMKEHAANRMTEIMVDADLAGIDSHGISMLPGYQNLVESGAVDIDAAAVVVEESDTTATIDGARSFGHATTAFAMETAIAKSRVAGVGAAAVRRSSHFGAAGYYAALAAEAGFIGLVTSTTRTRAVIPSGGMRPLMGTNPLAFAAPSADSSAPFVLDMSTSTVAVNKVKVFDYRGSPLPAGWVIDGSGRPTTESDSAYDIVRSDGPGGLTPLGGSPELSSHKGFGLAVMVEILAGALSGTAFGNERHDDTVGHFCLAIDPGVFGDHDAFLRSVSSMLAVIRSQPSMRADRPVLAAGDLERATREERRQHGIPISSALATQLDAICRKVGARFLLS